MNVSARIASGESTTTRPSLVMIRPPNAPRCSRKTVTRPSYRAPCHTMPYRAPPDAAIPSRAICTSSAMLVGAREKIGSPVEETHIDEPRDREKLPGPDVRLDSRLEEAVADGGESVEWKDPSRRGKLRCPDDVELENVWSAGASVEPLDVQLMSLRRV